MLSAKRDKKAASIFLKKVLKARQNKQPRVINVDKNAAYPPAIEELKQEGILSKFCLFIFFATEPMECLVNFYPQIKTGNQAK